MRFLISGATGLIGARLSQRLREQGHQIAILSRSLEKGQRLGYETIVWQPEQEPLAATALEGVDVVVHLTGEHIAAGRWTPEQKRRIRDSRVLSTRHLLAAMRASAVQPKAFICASAIGFYGDRGDEMLTEQAAPGTGFLSDICQEWEAEAAAAQVLGIRTVHARIGIVLARPEEGGALQQMVLPFKLGLGASLGNGQQWFPWVHIADVVGLLEHAIRTETLSGAMNTVAPNVVTNAEFTDTLAAALHRPSLFAVPGFMLRLGLGEMADMMLGSVRVIPAVALASGYQFQFPLLRAALADLFSPR
ncbi:MAG TPA: TIGR01777 family oxidoreductase [Blastocatellia bacterium]|nr:TIGR01777 family oxidoreductase [Blastocatellia bacterium]